MRQVASKVNEDYANGDLSIKNYFSQCHQGRREDGRGPGQIQKVGPIIYIDCGRGSGGTSPEKILRFYML